MRSLKRISSIKKIIDEYIESISYFTINDAHSLNYAFIKIMRWTSHETILHMTPQYELEGVSLRYFMKDDISHNDKMLFNDNGFDIIHQYHVDDNKNRRVTGAGFSERHSYKSIYYGAKDKYADTKKNL